MLLIIRLPGDVLTQHYGLDVFGQEFFCHPRRAVQDDVLDRLPVHPLQLLEEVQPVVGRLDLLDRLDVERLETVDILEIKNIGIENSLGRPWTFWR